MIVGQLYKLSADRTALIEDLDGVLDGVVGDLMSGNLLQLALYMIVLIHAELQAEGLEAVLGMSQENNRHLIMHRHTVVLAHGTQGIADGRRDDAVQLIHGSVQKHFQRQLSDGAVERRAVFLRAADGLIVAAPDSHGNHTGGINQLIGSKIGKNADDLLALGFIFLKLLLRSGSLHLKFI